MANSPLSAAGNVNIGDDASVCVCVCVSGCVCGGRVVELMNLNTVFRKPKFKKMLFFVFIHVSCFNTPPSLFVYEFDHVCVCACACTLVVFHEGIS